MFRSTPRLIRLALVTSPRAACKQIEITANRGPMRQLIRDSSMEVRGPVRAEPAPIAARAMLAAALTAPRAVVAGV